MIYLFGGFSTTYDRCIDDMFIFNMNSSSPHCVMVAGTKTKEESGWTDDELKKLGARVQKGELPGECSFSWCDFFLLLLNFYK